MSVARTFRELEVWKKGIELVQEIYGITENFPSRETYGLTSQMRRCAVSIPSNIAEGFRRRGSKEFKHFLSITQGSLAELETQIVISQRLSYLSTAEEADVLERIDHLCRMVTNLSRTL